MIVKSVIIDIINDKVLNIKQFISMLWLKDKPKDKCKAIKDIYYYNATDKTCHLGVPKCVSGFFNSLGDCNSACNPKAIGF